MSLMTIDAWEPINQNTGVFLLAKFNEDGSFKWVHPAYKTADGWVYAGNDPTMIEWKSYWLDDATHFQLISVTV